MMDRLFAVALFSVALASAAFAAQTPFEKFLNSTFEPDSSVAVKPLLANGSFVLVLSGGSETYVADSSSGKAVLDKGQMQRILVEDARNRTAFDANVAYALGLDEHIYSSKSEEAQCMRLTGIELRDCVDKDTCVLACMSNPNCLNVLYSDGFWEAVLEWNSGRKAFDGLVASYADGQEAVSGDAKAVAEKDAVLGQMHALALNMSMNTVFLNRTDAGCGANGTKRCYEYCPKVDYSADDISLGRQALAKISAAMEEMGGQQERAERILNRSRENDLYLSTRGKRYAEFKLDMADEIGKLNLSYASLLKKVNDTEIAGMIGSLQSLSERIRADGDFGLYKKALGQEAEFYSKRNATALRIASDLAAYESTLLRIDGLGGKVENGAWLLGNATSEAYLANLTGMRTNLTSAPVGIADIARVNASVGALENGMAEEMLARASSGQAVQQQMPKIPCLPAFAVLLVAAFACAREAGGRSV